MKLLTHLLTKSEYQDICSILIKEALGQNCPSPRVESLSEIQKELNFDHYAVLNRYPICYKTIKTILKKKIYKNHTLILKFVRDFGHEIRYDIILYENDFKNLDQIINIRIK